MDNPDLKKVAGKIAKFARGVVEEINRMPEVIKKRQLQIGALDENKFLGEAEAFFRREFNVKFHINKEDDPQLDDPQKKAGFAKPYRPAIYIK